MLSPMQYTCIKLNVFICIFYALVNSVPCSLPVAVPRRPVVSTSSVCMTPMLPAHDPWCPVKYLILLCSLLLHSQPPSPVYSPSQSPLLQGRDKQCQSYREDISSNIVQLYKSNTNFIKISMKYFFLCPAMINLSALYYILQHQMF